ncbi:MAG: hypothetical protein H0W86_04390 [Armatimonadetes bacterium]|nr:hypothetical protein [Armatimonadota bacterium]
MKRLLVAAAFAAVVLGLVGCDKKEEPVDATTPPAGATAPTQPSGGM